MNILLYATEAANIDKSRFRNVWPESPEIKEPSLSVQWRKHAIEKNSDEATIPFSPLPRN